MKLVITRYKDEKICLYLTFADYTTVSNRAEATEIKSIEKFETHASTVGIIKTCAIIEARVGGTWICHYQFC